MKLNFLTSAAAAAISVALFACVPSADDAQPSSDSISDNDSDYTLEFEAIYDAPTRSVTIAPLFDRTARGLEDANTVRTPGSTADTVELLIGAFTTDASGATCGFANSVCVDVAVTSHYGVDLVSTFAQVDAIAPLAGHHALNSDAATGNLTNTFGLFGYGTIAPNGSSTRRWVYSDNGTSFRLKGHIAANFLRTPRGSPIAVNPNGNTLAVANVRTNDITLFVRSTTNVRARVSSGGEEPVSVSWAPNSRTLYVVNRKSQNVVRFSEAQGPSPTISATVNVGSEPGLASLSPNGSLLFVPNMADGTVTVIRTSDMTIQATIDLGGSNPYATCMTNDGDADDSDETLFVTDFYARADPTQREATDAARRGRIFSIPVSTLSPSAIDLSAFPNVFAPFAGTGAYPNQLYGCSVNRGLVYIPNVGASPASFAGATDFHQNIQGLVSVVDVNGTENLARRVNLNSLVDGLTAPRRFMSVPVAMEFIPGTENAFVISRNSDAVLKVHFDPSAAPSVGFPSTIKFIDTRDTTAPAGRPNVMSPMGIAVYGTRAYVYNEVSQSVTELDIQTNARVRANFQSSALPALGSPQEIARRGQAFFDTGLGRWSSNGWVGCVGCHPFGQTDNVTWSFPAGPRQTIDLSASFDPSGTVQRIFNWSAIFDEVADFELNVRTVSGGVGAIVHTVSNPPVTTDRIDIAAIGQSGNIGSAAETAFGNESPEDATIGELADWLDLTAWMKTIRSPRGHASANAANGRLVFQNLGCQNCHGGALWTLSERYNTPARNENCTGVSLAAAGVSSVNSVPASQVRTTDTSQLLVIGPDAGAPAGHECVKRIVGTFDNAGPGARGAAELRQTGAAAQGAFGFNVPSLLGMATGAPYLHHGGAESLEELLDPAGAYTTHLNAGNTGAAPSASDVTDLIAFVRSIDETTPSIPVTPGFTFCPGELSPTCAP